MMASGSLRRPSSSSRVPSRSGRSASSLRLAQIAFSSTRLSSPGAYPWMCRARPPVVARGVSGAARGQRCTCWPLALYRRLFDHHGRFRRGDRRTSVPPTHRRRSHPPIFQGAAPGILHGRGACRAGRGLGRTRPCDREFRTGSGCSLGPAGDHRLAAQPARQPAVTERDPYRPSPG